MEIKPSKKRLSEFYNCFPNSRIREKMDELGLKSNNLSDKMNEILTDDKKITSEAVRQWVSGYTRPDIARLVAVADVLDCSTDYLLGRDERPTFESQYISDTIGITQKSIEVLKKIAGELSDAQNAPNLIALNAIIQGTDFPNFLFSFFSYIFGGDICYINGIDLSTKESFSVFTKSESLIVLPSDGMRTEPTIDAPKYFQYYDGERFKQILQNASMSEMQEFLINTRKELLRKDINKFEKNEEI